MMALELPTALLWTQRILGAGLAVQTMELLLTRRIFERHAALAGHINVTGALALRLLGALALVALPPFACGWLRGVVVGGILVSSLWLTVRSRGPVCGGSDSMFFQVQLGLFFASWGGAGDVLPRLGLGWIAAHSVLSYFLAGMGKARHGGWWNGDALRHLFASNGLYVLLAITRRAAERRWFGMLGGWLIVGFELAFPVVLIAPPEVKWAMLGLGLAFHLGNAVVLGLNRFVWAWLATYPALLYFQ